MALDPTLDPEETFVGGNGALFIGPVGTPFPTAGEDPDPDDWTAVGFLSDKGVVVDTPITTKPVTAWQSFYALRQIPTESDAKVTIEIEQWNSTTLRLAYGGGDVTSLGGGFFKYTPPPAGTLEEFACLVVAVDGSFTVQYRFTRVTNATGVSTSFVRDTNSMLPVTLTVLAPPEGVDEAFDIVSDAPGFDDALASI